MTSKPAPKGGKRQIVQVTTDRLRERIFAQASGEQVGSLPDLAREFGVGIVTVQQAARILEHEGMLEVRRGAGGGYYGRRPDIATLERALASYMRSEPASRREVLDMTSLLFNELCAAAARCEDEPLRRDLRAFAKTVETCTNPQQVGVLEEDLQNLLFRMVNRPLFELLTRVALRMASEQEDGHTTRRHIGLEPWKESRRHIIGAILQRDPELAHFEANRRNRRLVLALSEA